MTAAAHASSDGNVDTDPRIAQTLSRAAAAREALLADSDRRAALEARNRRITQTRRDNVLRAHFARRAH
jgi:hypothetical protein